MKTVGWIIVLFGLLSLLPNLSLFKPNEFTASMIVTIWGGFLVLYKKYDLKDGGLIFYGVFIVGIGVYGISYVENPSLIETSRVNLSDLIIMLLLTFGGGVLIYKGYKKHMSTKKR